MHLKETNKNCTLILLYQLHSSFSIRKTHVFSKLTQLSFDFQDHICFCVLKLFLKKFNFFLFFSLFQINNCFGVFKLF